MSDESPALTPEEAAKEAFLDAAEKFVDAVPGKRLAEDHPEFCALYEAFKALRAIRPPKGVKPEEVEPGTLFEFSPETNRPCVFGPYKTVLCVEPDRVVRWIRCAGGHVHGFTSTDRIIPIDPEPDNG